MPVDVASIELRDQPPELLDPQKDYGGPSTELWRCLVRTLLSHNGRSTEEGGSRVHPDLAAALPEVSADGLTWTIRLKEGLHYGPPLEDVEITAPDFVRSFHRLLSPAIASDWSWDFTVIEGAAAYQAGTAASISGLEAPDDHTLVVRLTEPQGDFGARLAEPATGPLPPDPAHPDAAFGIAEGADDGYGRFLVSSGPHMLEGSEKLDLSVPVAQRATPSGLAPGRITLVRNPSWDPASDDLRQAYPDRIEISVVDSVDAAVAALDAGTADLVWPSPGNARPLPPEVVAAFQRDPARGRVHVDAGSAVRGLIMNLALPPFDDIHVRRAVNYAIDKQHLLEIQGGPADYEIVGHIAADSYLDDLLRDYDPYATPGGKGDLEKARAEMAQSRYDSDGDGRCDAVACQKVRTMTRDEFAATTTAVADDLAALGIDLQVEVTDMQTFFTLPSDPREKIALLVGMGCRSAHVAATACLEWFDGRLTTDAQFGNLTLMGTTPEQLRGWGYEVVEVPNVDDRIEACVPLIGSAQFQCWAAVDQYLMENVVPWAPYSRMRVAAITSPRVLTYAYDELAGSTSLGHLALSP